MTHDNAKSMLFHFLKTRDYNKDSGQLAFDYGYDLGDYSPDDKQFYEIARDCAQLLRTRLAGVFKDDGSIDSSPKRGPRDRFGEFHQEK